MTRVKTKAFGSVVLRRLPRSIRPCEWILCQRVSWCVCLSLSTIIGLASFTIRTHKHVSGSWRTSSIYIIHRRGWRANASITGRATRLGGIFKYYLLRHTAGRLPRQFAARGQRRRRKASPGLSNWQDYWRVESRGFQLRGGRRGGVKYTAESIKKINKQITGQLRCINGGERWRSAKAADADAASGAAPRTANQCGAVDFPISAAAEVDSAHQC